MRKPVMAGNWKMYKTAAETRAAIEKLAPRVAGAKHCGSRDLRAVREFAGGGGGGEGDQYRDRRAGRFLAEGRRVHGRGFGAHAEGSRVPVGDCRTQRAAAVLRRDRETVAKKTVGRAGSGLKPIVCVGERLEQREAGSTDAVLATQFTGGLRAGLTVEQFMGVTIAYEPVWAIGTGKTATPEMAAEAHQF